MADTSLDEFFARKDKSRKGRNRAKYTTTDTIAKKLEESGKKTETLPKKDQKEKVVNFSASIQSSISNPVMEQEDDEWKDIEEREKDYSGLRIQALSISEKEKEEEQSKEQQVDQNGETLKTSEAQSGPWRIMSPAAAGPALPNEPEQTVECEEKEDKPKQVYKIPQIRSMGNTSGGPKGLKSAPEISSELHFPSLSAAADPSGKGKISEQSSDRSFQSVKHGIKTKGETHQGVHLDLENKFSPLHQEN